MQTIAILGAGRVGNAMARDLADKFSITSFDIDIHSLQKLADFDNIKIQKLDLQKTGYNKIL